MPHVPFRPVSVGDSVQNGNTLGASEKESTSGFSVLDRQRNNEACEETVFLLTVWHQLNTAKYHCLKDNMSGTILGGY